MRWCVIHVLELAPSVCICYSKFFLHSPASLRYVRLPVHCQHLLLSICNPLSCINACVPRRLLKTGSTEKLSDTEIEEYLEKTVQLFSYLTDQDLFAEIYRNQ
jgi:hypothetical protein